MSHPKQGDYRAVGLRVYGTACEYDGCGWQEAATQVHHLDYRFQQAQERELRYLLATGNQSRYRALILVLQGLGYYWDEKSRDLTKSMDPLNLAVLCPNHHAVTHALDQGTEILKHLPPRKSA